MWVVMRTNYYAPKYTLYISYILQNMHTVNLVKHYYILKLI